VLGVAAILVAACTPSAPVRTPTYQPSYGTNATSPDTRETSPLPVPTAPAPAPPQTFNPSTLIGLDGDQVEQLLGAATLRRREPPAQVWQYPGQGCVLHLFLYEKDGAYRVEYFEARNSEGNIEKDAACIDGVVDGQTTPAAN